MLVIQVASIELDLRIKHPLMTLCIKFIVIQRSLIVLLTMKTVIAQPMHRVAFTYFIQKRSAV